MYGWPQRDAHHLLVSSEDMAALEQRLFASGLPVEALMEKAALAVSRRLLDGVPPADGAAPADGALVLVGPGHNGGDGLVVARELHLAGLPVRIWSPFERHRPLTDSHLRHARWLGIPLLEQPPDPDDPALWIDALFGIGQQRPPTETISTLLAERHRARPGALRAIDVPSGLCADSGRRLGPAAASAAITYCIGLIKRGLVQDPALAHVGDLDRIDLGLPAALLEELPGDRPLGLLPGDRAHATWPRGNPAAAKYERGRVLVIAGSDRFRGAAHLALAGASASGCGSIHAAVPQQVEETLWQVLPHVVLTEVSEEALERVDAILVGPGLGDGRTPGADLLSWEALRSFGGLLVLDADGLNRLAALEGKGAITVAAWLQARVGPTWLTPHPGEFARLFPDLAVEPPLEAAAAASQRCGASILLKGARSVVAAPDGRRWQLLRASSAAARAGLGDVLAGYAAGRGAMAMAAGCETGLSAMPEGDGMLLAAAALDHACAGLQAETTVGRGALTPLAVAEALGRQR